MVKEYFKVGFTVISFIVMFLFCSPSVFASEISISMKATIDEVINIVTDENLKNQAQARRDKLREALGKRFNYHQMAMRSLAKEWKERTPQEKKEFHGLFKRLLENSGGLFSF